MSSFLKCEGTFEKCMTRCPCMAGSSSSGSSTRLVRASSPSSFAVIIRIAGLLTLLSWGGALFQPSGTRGTSRPKVRGEGGDLVPGSEGRGVPRARVRRETLFRTRRVDCAVLRSSRRVERVPPLDHVRRPAMLMTATKVVRDPRRFIQHLVNLKPQKSFQKPRTQKNSSPATR